MIWNFRSLLIFTWKALNVKEKKLRIRSFVVYVKSLNRNKYYFWKKNYSFALFVVLHFRERFYKHRKEYHQAQFLDGNVWLVGYFYEPNSEIPLNGRNFFTSLICFVFCQWNCTIVNSDLSYLPSNSTAAGLCFLCLAFNVTYLQQYLLNDVSKIRVFLNITLILLSFCEKSDSLNSIILFIGKDFNKYISI